MKSTSWRRSLLFGIICAQVLSISQVALSQFTTLGTSTPQNVSGAPPEPLTLVHQNAATSGASGQPSISVTLTGTTSGNLLTVYSSYYAPGSLPSHSTSTDNGSSFFEATGTDHYDVTIQEGNFLWYGINAAGGSVTCTSGFGAPAGSFASIYVQEWSGNAASGNDTGIGNSGTDVSSMT